MIRIRHLVIGARDLAQSEVFYREVLGFRLVDALLDTSTERESLVMVAYDEDGAECAELRFVPLEGDRLPSPNHLALEVSPEAFDLAISAARKYQLPIRSFPALDSEQAGPSVCEYRGQLFEHFYLLEPGGGNLEILRRLRPA